MVPDPEQVKALVDAGGWTLFVTTIALAVVGLMRRWIVMGWIYQREVERSDRLELTLKSLTAAVRRLAAKKRDA